MTPQTPKLETRHSKLKPVLRRLGASFEFRFSLAAVALALIVSLAPSAAATNVTGTVSLPDGTPVTGTIEFVLSQRATTTTPPALVVPERTTCGVTNGQIDAGCTVQGNDTLTPAGTFYRVRILDQNNRPLGPTANYTFAGSTVDIGSLPVTATDTLVPPAGSVVGDLNVAGNLTVGGSADFAADPQEFDHLRLRGLTADPASPIDGSLWNRSDLERIRFQSRGLQLFDGANFVDITAGTNSIDIAGDLKVGGGTDLGGFADLKCSSEPAAPGGSATRLYCLSTDEQYFFKDSGGVPFGPLASINRVTSWPAQQNFKNANNIRYCDQFAGADAAAKIAACIADLPATGGIADARGLIGAQSFGSNPFAGVTKPVTLLTGAATFSWNPEVVSVTLPGDFTLVMNGTRFTTSAQGLGGLSGFNGLFNTRVTQTTGNIAENTAALTVASTANFHLGDMVAVLGAEGGNTNQETTIADGGDGIDSSQSTIGVASVSGWANSGNTIEIEGEIIQCAGTSGASFTGCTRGRFGTVPAAHSEAAAVDAVGYFISRVIDINGSVVTLADDADLTVSNATVLVGSTNIAVRGHGMLDGNQNRAGADPAQNLFGIYATLARSLTIGPDIRFVNFDHGGVELMGSADSVVDGVFESNGRPAQALGADIWLFGKNWRHTVRSGSQRDGNVALAVDDRTATFTLFDGPTEDCSAYLGAIEGYKNGVILSGSNHCSVYASRIDAPAGQALSIATGQWTTNPVPLANSITAGATNGTVGFGAGTDNGGNTISVGSSTNNVTVTPGNAALYGTSAGTIRLSTGTLQLENQDAADATRLHFLSGATTTWNIESSTADDLRIIDVVTGPNTPRTLLVKGGNSELNALGSGEVRLNFRSGSGTGGLRVGDGSGGTVFRTTTTGLGGDELGFKHKRVATGSIAAGQSAAVALTWTTPFADTNYTVSCTVEDATASTLALRLHHVESKTAAAVTARLVNDDGASSHSGTLDCTAIHD